MMTLPIAHSTRGQGLSSAIQKDYTGDQVTTANFYAVLLGNKTAVTGGSRKVIDSKPNDHIFIYYSDHGGPGVLASNAGESSWGTYCPGMEPLPPSEYITCLGDLYSVSWMEDSETHNLKEETIKYVVVKKRTSDLSSYSVGSHVMEYGDKTLKDEKHYLYQGFDPANANITNKLLCKGPKATVNQRDAYLLFLWRRYELLHEKSEEKMKVLREISEAVMHRKHLDTSVDFIGKLLFGVENGPSLLQAVRPSGLPLVDDWDCLKRMLRIFESHCGSLTRYGMKHMRAFANICNNGIPDASMKEASISACGSHNSARWSPLIQGYSA